MKKIIHNSLKLGQILGLILICGIIELIIHETGHAIFIVLFTGSIPSIWAREYTFTLIWFEPVTTLQLMIISLNAYILLGITLFIIRKKDTLFFNILRIVILTQLIFNIYFNPHDFTVFAPWQYIIIKLGGIIIFLMFANRLSYIIKDYLIERYQPTYPHIQPRRKRVIEVASV